MPDQPMTVRDHYLEQMVESANQEGLLLLLVDGAVNFIRRAEVALEREKFDEANNCLIKAQNIYLELTITLDLDVGEFAENMGNLYQFLYNLLIEANMDKDVEKVRSGLKLAEQIKDIWKESISVVRQEANPDGEKEVPVPDNSSKPLKTGVYAPRTGSGISEEKTDLEDSTSRLNITG